MNETNDQPSQDPLDDLIETAKPEMERVRDAASMGFETRLREALPPRRGSGPLATWDVVTTAGCRIAAVITTLVALQFTLSGAWKSSASSDLMAFAVERMLLGI